MGSEVYDRDDSYRRRRQHDDDAKRPDGEARGTKRSHRDKDSSDKYSRRARSADRDNDRHKRRRRSRSPESRSRRQRSLDRDSGHNNRARDSRSPGEGSHSERRSRRTDEESKGGSWKQHHRRRRSRSGEAEYDRPPKRIENRPDEDDGAGKQVSARRSGPLLSQADSFAVSTGEEPEMPKEKPNFGNSGLLATASNSVTQADGTTITLKYHEPPEARKPPPRDQWKLFVFKGKDLVDTIELSARSCWLVGREAAIVDLLAENPSISKQHAVIQFRFNEKRNEFGDKIGRVKPYLIDLESANGTHLNGEQVPNRRYLELRPKDVVKFGTSEREYVVMLSRG